MYCQVPPLLGLPHCDVLNPVRAEFSSATVLECLLSSSWIIQSINQQLLLQEITLPCKSPKSDIASACPLAAATGARQNVSSRECAMYTNKGLVVQGENSGRLCYASDPMSSH